MADYGSGYAQDQPTGDNYDSNQAGGYGDQGAGYGGDSNQQGGYGGDGMNQQGAGDQYGSSTAPDQVGGDNFGADQSAYGSSDQSDQTAQDQGQEKTDRRREDEAGLGGLAAGGVALYERHEMKADPEHAGRHKLEEELAGGGAVGLEGGALYERHEKKDEEKQVAEDSGEKKHGWF
ncbi:unnamed protein product [Calypogeia fissa]